MSQPDSEAPPVYTEYDVDVTAGQTGNYPSAKDLTEQIEDLPKETPKITHGESQVAKTMRRLKINNNPFKKNQSSGELHVTKTLQGININRGPYEKHQAPEESNITKTLKGIKIDGSPYEKHQSPGEPNVTKTLKGIKIDSSPYEKAPTPGPPGTKDDLFNAISKDDLARVRELLDGGVDIESRYESQGGKTPLMVAVGYDKVDIAELLLQRGTDVNAKTFHTEETALMSACSSGRSQIITLILEREKVDLEARDRNRRTALMMASAQGYEWEMKALVKAGADLEARDDNGRTALTTASRFGRSGAASLLMKFGAKKD